MHKEKPIEPIKDSFKLEELNLKLFYQKKNNRDLKHNQIILIKEGVARLMISDKTIEVSGYEVILIPKNEHYDFHFSESLKGLILSFGDCIWERTLTSTNDCKSILFGGVLFRRIKLDNESFKPISSLMNILYGEFLEANYINKIDVLAAYLKILMVKVANIHKSLCNNYSDYDKQLYYHFLQQVEEKSYKRLNVNEYALLLSTTSKKLTRICNIIGGTTPKNIIDSKTISDAKYQLMFTIVPIKEISANLNFNSIYQFSHFFKSHTGLSPKSYRTSISQIDK